MFPLLDSPFVSSATRSALLERVQPTITPPRYFSEAELTLLQAVALRLAGPIPATGPIDMARPIDERLADGKSNGWRYNDMPTDGEAYKLGLTGIDQHAQRRFGQAFIALPDAEKDAVLTDVQQGNVPDNGSWQRVSPKRFFEELLTEITEYLYAHPYMQEAIGYVGYADL
ncbi:gluconate 2-dehydrogenase subunit 3 family protein [Fibrella sp. WM1]|uniref:gluconate 2-dehydrogenase subunit 3 family protein n=1 Tax=Fibrella musci TaxID=3242485 RepID=UPI0035223D95